MTPTSIYFLLEGFAIAFFGILGVQNLWHRDERLRCILGAILIYWMAQHVYSVVFTSDVIHGLRHWSQIINAVDMTSEPTCCFLLLELCRPGWLNWRRGILHMSPFITLAVIYIICEQDWVYQIMLGYFVVYGLVITVSILYYIPKYNRFLREHYSYDENVNLSWLYYMLITFFVLMIIYAVSATYDTVVGDSLYIWGSVVGWGMVCYFISRQESVLYELKSSEREAHEILAAATEIGTVPSSIDLEDKIMTRFIKPQIYLRPQLKLGDMAEILGTNRTYLSRYLNEQLHTTFYDYVNALRLEHAVNMIMQTDYSIQAIASIAGFNSYSTFRRTFIAKYGKSPQEYKRNLMQ